MDKLWIVTTYENHEYKQVPIVLSDDWLVSEAYVMDGYVHLKNASDGTVIKVRLSDLVDNPMGKGTYTYKRLSNTLIDGISEMVDSDFIHATKRVNDYSNAAITCSKICKRREVCLEWCIL